MTLSPDEITARLAWIGVDWGTSALRVNALDREGNSLARFANDSGMAGLRSDQFEPALLSVIEQWLPGEAGARIPVLICGMAGSRQGWFEAPYREVPCGAVSATGLTRVATEDPRLDVRIIPGLSQADPADVMRGEETQIAGLLATGITDATVCLPGTHSKWVELAEGLVTGFSTVMTGELYSLVAKHSILRHSIGPETGQIDEGAFLAGVDRAAVAPELLTSDLFSIRARSLLGHGDDAASTLSGLLIGAELAGQKHRWQERPVHVIGDTALAGLYARALGRLNARAIVMDGSTLALAAMKPLARTLEVVPT